MWIRLTVCGVTRLGYGAADGKQGGDAVKEIIGDALRNAAMRFGAALDLWHKGDLHADEAEAEPAPKHDPVSDCLTPAQELELDDLIRDAGVDKLKFLGRAGVKETKHLPAAKFAAAKKLLNEIIDKTADKPRREPQRKPEFSDIGDDFVPY
jgi:hypothetical protein